MKKSIISLVLLITVISGFAQAPMKMSYQCVVRKSNGELVVNQNIGLRISILQGSPSGNIIYQETYAPNPQTNANGLVTVEIGGGEVVTGNLSEINWASGIYFLKTETDPSGGINYTISGSSQLLSVPYSLYAKTAENGFSGKYEDLSNKPVLFSGYYNDLLNAPLLFDGTWASLAGKPTFATVASSGSYNDLTNRPTLFNGTWTSLTGKPSFATVATSGSYNDLSDQPVSMRETTDEFTAGASQTTFNLNHTPAAANQIKMYINGVRISNFACTTSGSRLTYDPSDNNSYSLMAGDRIQFDYFY
jgi:peptide methionine sulfoxide reductase MsrB